MEITKEQEELLKAKLGEKEFNEIINPIEFNASKVYLLKWETKIFQLVQTTYKKLIWLNMDNTMMHLGGMHDRSAIQQNKHFKNAQQFDSIQDAIEKGFFKTTQKTLDKYWCVKRDNSDGFEKVIKHLNEGSSRNYSGNYFLFYGFDGYASHADYVSQFKNNPTLYTVKEFLEITGL